MKNMISEINEKVLLIKIKDLRHKALIYIKIIIICREIDIICGIIIDRYK